MFYFYLGVRVNVEVSANLLLNEAMTKLWAKSKDIPQLKHYPVEETVTKSKKAYDDLIKLKEDTVGWKPVLDLQHKRASFYDKVMDYEESTAEVQSYRDIITEVRMNHKVNVASDKRQYRSGRDRFTAVFNEKGTSVPSCVAKVGGDTLFAAIENPSEHGIKLTCATVKEVDAENLDQGDFVSPFIIRPDIEKSTWLHDECKKRIDKNKTAIDDKIVASVQDMRVNTAKNCTYASIEPKSAFLFNHDEFARKVTAPNTRLVIGTTKVAHVHCAIEFTPYRTHGHYFHQITGTSILVFLDVDVVRAHPNIDAWLASLPSTALSRMPSRLISAGWSAWVPFGWMPIVLGVPSHALVSGDDASAKKPGQASEGLETVSYAMTLCYDTVNDMKHSADVKLHVASLWVQASAHIFRGVKENAKAWEAKLHEEASGMDD